MVNFLNNPWTIGVGVTVLGGLILYYLFGIGKPKKESADTRKAGVIDEGINSTYIDCEGAGPDAGLISKGKGLKSINSKWSSRDEVVEAQKQRFEENKKNHFDPRNSNK
ncbi:MAG: hypothetical protein WC694_01230 [Candidatus Paceibacterota bacterium]|jgi:hypothetical protein